MFGPSVRGTVRPSSALVGVFSSGHARCRKYVSFDVEVLCMENGVLDMASWWTLSHQFYVLRLFFVGRPSSTNMSLEMSLDLVLEEGRCWSCPCLPDACSSS